MNERTTLELECQCGGSWEAKGYADYPWWDLVPEPVEVDDFECPRCWKHLTPRSGEDSGDAVLGELGRQRDRIEALGAENARLRDEAMRYAEIVVEGMAGRPNADDTARFVRAMTEEGSGGRVRGAREEGAAERDRPFGPGRDVAPGG